MLRTMLAIAAGYFSITILDSLVHVIVSVYFQTELSLSGIANLPSIPWVVGVTILQFCFGLFAGLLASTIVHTKKYLAALGLILLMVIIGCLDYTVLSKREPLWYLITSPALKIVGIFLGYRLILLQNKKLAAG